MVNIKTRLLYGLCDKKQNKISKVITRAKVNTKYYREV